MYGFAFAASTSSPAGERSEAASRAYSTSMFTSVAQATPIVCEIFESGAHLLYTAVISARLPSTDSRDRRERTAFQVRWSKQLPKRWCDVAHTTAAKTEGHRRASNASMTSAPGIHSISYAVLCPAPLLLLAPHTLRRVVIEATLALTASL